MSKRMICPHCQTQGSVKVNKKKRKKGISGGKVMAGVATGGWSLLATGLSRKEKTNHAKCSNCKIDWDF